MAPDREAKSNENNFNTKQKMKIKRMKRNRSVSTYKFEHLNLKNSFLIRLELWGNDSSGL